MAESEEPSEIVSQLGWLVKTFWSAKLSGLLAGVIMAGLAAFSLNQPNNQTYVTRIIYGLQPKLVKSEIDQRNVMRLIPVIPENFTSKQVLIWYNIDFVSLIKEASNKKYKRLDDIGFDLSNYDEGWLLITTGKAEEREIHRSFQKNISDILLDKLHEEEAHVTTEISNQIAFLKRQLSGIEAIRSVITAERERSVKLMEEIVEKAGSSGNLNRPQTKQNSVSNSASFLEARPDDGFSRIILALTGKLEKLMEKSDQLHSWLSDYDRMGKQATRARIVTLAFSSETKGSVSFVFKLAVWLFLIIFVTLTVPFIWVLSRAVRSAIKA